MKIHWGDIETRNDWSVQETEQYLYIFFYLLILSTVNCPELILTTAGAWHFFLLYGGSQTYKCITATYLSNGLLTLATISIRSGNGPFERQWSIDGDTNTVQFLAQTNNRLVSLDLNVSSRATGFNLVLSVYVFWLSKPWIPFTVIIWLTDCTSLS